MHPEIKKVSLASGLLVLFWWLISNAPIEAAPAPIKPTRLPLTPGQLTDELASPNTIDPQTPFQSPDLAETAESSGYDFEVGGLNLESPFLLKLPASTRGTFFLVPPAEMKVAFPFTVHTENYGTPDQIHLFNMNAETPESNDDGNAVLIYKITDLPNSYLIRSHAYLKDSPGELSLYANILLHYGRESSLYGKVIKFSPINESAPEVNNPIEGSIVYVSKVRINEFNSGYHPDQIGFQASVMDIPPEIKTNGKPKIILASCMGEDPTHFQPGDAGFDSPYRGFIIIEFDNPILPNLPEFDTPSTP